jgi:hypothetical protein
MGRAGIRPIETSTEAVSIDRITSIVLSNGSRRRLLPSVDAFGMPRGIGGRDRAAIGQEPRSARSFSWLKEIVSNVGPPGLPVGSVTSQAVLPLLPPPRVAGGMPCEPGVDLLSAALATALASARLRHDDTLGEPVHIHVGGVPAGFAASDDERTPFCRILARVIGGPAGARASGMI